MAGAGAMLGACLGVVLPESFEAFAANRLSNGFIGWFICLGFVVMLALDAAFAHEHPGLAGHHQPAKLRISPEATPSARSDLEGGGGEASALLAAKRGRRGAKGRGGWLQLDPASRTVLALCVHSIADGFAMGAAAASDDEQLNFMVALAIILHKIPASFGLAAYLLGVGRTVPAAINSILLFAAMTPLGAVVTYLCLTYVPGAAHNQEAIGASLLVSSGTFIHAACIHVLPEVCPGGHLGGRELAAFGVGLLVPLGLSFLHDD